MYHITKSAPGCCRTINGGFFFACGNRHNVRMRVPSLARWGVYPQTRPGWGMEPAPERKRGRGIASRAERGCKGSIEPTPCQAVAGGGDRVRIPYTRCTRAGTPEPHQNREPHRAAAALTACPPCSAAFHPVQSATVRGMTQKAKVSLLEP